MRTRRARDTRTPRRCARRCVGGELRRAEVELGVARCALAVAVRSFRFQMYAIISCVVLVGCFLLVETGIALCNAYKRKSHDIIHHDEYLVLTTGYWLLATDYSPHPPPLPLTTD